MRNGVTDIPCTCGYLEREANNPHTPIIFDALVHEYQFAYPDPDGDGTTTAHLIIYHCPWCGGAAPKSKRGLLFAEIHPEEEKRLRDLLAPIKTAAEMQRLLGPPDDSRREFQYKSLSESAEVTIFEFSEGGVHFRISSKYLGGHHRSELDSK